MGSDLKGLTKKSSKEKTYFHEENSSAPALCNAESALQLSCPTVHSSTLQSHPSLLQYLKGYPQMIDAAIATQACRCGGGVN